MRHMENENSISAVVADWLHDAPSVRQAQDVVMAISETGRYGRRP